MKNITAYLRFNGFEKRVKLSEFLQEYREVVKQYIPVDYSSSETLMDIAHRKMLVFEWRRQLTKFTHEFTLKEII